MRSDGAVCGRLHEITIGQFCFAVFHLTTQYFFEFSNFVKSLNVQQEKNIYCEN